VIAAGGGAVLNPDTRRDFQAAGPVIWLKASVDTIEKRLCGDATTGERRPNLTASGGRAEIEELLATREPLYRETATVTIMTDTPLHGQNQPPTIAELTDLILTRIASLLPDDVAIEHRSVPDPAGSGESRGAAGMGDARGAAGSDESQAAADSGDAGVSSNSSANETSASSTDTPPGQEDSRCL